MCWFDSMTLLHPFMSVTVFIGRISHYYRLVVCSNLTSVIAKNTFLWPCINEVDDKQRTGQKDWNRIQLSWMIKADYHEFIVDTSTPNEKKKRNRIVEQLGTLKIAMNINVFKFFVFQKMMICLVSWHIDKVNLIRILTAWSFPWFRHFSTNKTLRLIFDLTERCISCDRWKWHFSQSSLRSSTRLRSTRNEHEE